MLCAVHRPRVSQPSLIGASLLSGEPDMSSFRRMPVFLYNYSDRTMHGIFKAVSEGDLEINPRGTHHPLTFLQGCKAPQGPY